MKKSDIIKLVKETVAERRKRYGQHDYYGNNVGGRNSISGMPGVWEEENLDEEGESWGLEPRQLADSFTFEELEQLYNDNKITKEDLNGATSYLQSWIDMHPTYLPQRDLTTPKRQEIRNKYLNEIKMKNKIKEDITDDISKAEDEVQAATQAKADAESKVADARKKKADGEKSALEETHDLEHIQKGKMVHLNKYFENIREMKLGDGTITVGNALMDLVPGESYISKGSARMFSGEEPASSKFSEPLAEYMKERGDSNLMEHMDRHRKRTQLMEGAVKRLFIDFDLGKTNEEIIQDYATKGIQIPDSWISQMRKEWEGFEKMKLNLDIGEKEFKNAATQIVNNPEGSETGMEPPIESKQLASGLSN